VELHKHVRLNNNYYLLYALKATFAGSFFYAIIL